MQECGQSDAFDCPELDKVAFEIEKVERWMFQCHAVVKPLVGDLGSLSDELEKVCYFCQFLAVSLINNSLLQLFKISLLFFFSD